MLSVGAGRAGDLPLPAHRRRPRSFPASRCRCRSSAPSGPCTCSGFSLNNLSLMALTISTGFVVDDAIVMIENIARYIEAGEPPLPGGAQGRRADRLHHPVAHRLADRGAHPAAVHGRRGGPALPRVRGHARHHDPHLGGGVADAHADDVRHGCCATRRPSGRAGSTAGPSACSSGSSRPTARACAGCSATSRRPCWWRSATLGAHDRALRGGAQGLLPGAGHRRDPGHLRGAAVDLVPGHGRAPAGAGRA